LTRIVFTPTPMQDTAVAHLRLHVCLDIVRVELGQKLRAGTHIRPYRVVTMLGTRRFAPMQARELH
jgi:hypothetical protein